jgi:hypothetical protein
MRAIPALRLLAVLLCLYALGAAGVLAGSAEPEEELILRVHVMDRDKEIPKLATMDLDLAGVDVKANTADFAGDRTTYAALAAAGFFPEIVWSSRTARPAALSQYLAPAEVSAKLDFYQASYPTLARKVAIGTTAQGRTEWALEFGQRRHGRGRAGRSLRLSTTRVRTTEIAVDISTIS